MNLGQIKNSLIGRGIASSLSQYMDTWVNEAYDIIYNSYLWDWKVGYHTLAYTVGTQDYALTTVASDCESIISMVQSGYPPLTRVPLYQFLNSLAMSESGDRPLAYTMVGSSLRLGPVHASAGTIGVYYNKTKTDLVADADIPLIPTKWHYVLVQLAYAKALSYDDNDAWEREYGIYLGYLKDMKREQNINIDEFPKMPFVRPDGGGLV